MTEAHSFCFHFEAQSAERSHTDKLTKLNQAKPILHKNLNGPRGNDTYRVFLLFVFVLAGFPIADKIVQGPILHQSRKDEDEANRYKKIHCCDIGDLGERFPGNGTEGGHC